MRKINEVSRSWLEQVSGDLKTAGVDLDDRYEHAINRWRLENEDDFNLREGENAKELEFALDRQIDKIKSYFLTQRNRDIGYVEGPFTGVYYYQGVFWELNIPLVFGRPHIAPLSYIKMDDELKGYMSSDGAELKEFVHVFADSYDYAYSVDELERHCANPTSLQFFLSGDKHLRAVKALLHQDKVSSKAVEDARMAVEMFLKGFISHVDGLNDDELRRTYRHGLAELMDRCEQTGAVEITSLRPEILAFPDVGSRYRVEERTFGELWSSYLLTLRAGLAVLRLLSGRDLRRNFAILQS